MMHTLIGSRDTASRMRLRLIAAAILLIGLCSAFLIYLNAGDDSDSVPGYENSKMYTHDLELYGGKANVLADEFVRWFAALWHGKSLAFMIACIAIFISFGFFFAAGRLPSHLKSYARSENNRAGTD